MTDFGNTIGDLISRNKAEVTEHDFHNRAQSPQGRSQRNARKTIFRNRHGEYSSRKQLKCVLGEPADATGKTVNIFTHDDDCWVFLHCPTKNIGRSRRKTYLHKLVGGIVLNLAKASIRELLPVAKYAFIDTFC